jgi:hypothetical protein
VPAAPTYDQLWEQGAALRVRVAEPRSDLETAAFLREVRSWQLRCTAYVAAIDASRSVDFRMLSGPLQRLTVDSRATLGWAAPCEESLAAWLTMVDWMRLLSHDDGHRAIAARLAWVPTATDGTGPHQG